MQTVTVAGGEYWRASTTGGPLPFDRRGTQIVSTLNNERASAPSAVTASVTNLRPSNRSRSRLANSGGPLPRSQCPPHDRHRNEEHEKFFHDCLLNAQQFEPSQLYSSSCG
jgi:hypothetical protein